MDFCHHNSDLLIAIGGVYGALGIPPFEFFQVTKSLPVNKIYLRDPNQSWYHGGLPGISKDIVETVDFLQKLIDFYNISNVVIVGNSMGGFAAILFGTLLNAQTVHAFSPQTFIDRFSRWRYSDRRWQNKIGKIYDLKSIKFFSLKKVIKKKKPDTNIYVYYSANDRLDEIHAKQLVKFKNVNNFVFPCGGHNLIKLLRDNGKLINIIGKSF